MGGLNETIMEAEPLLSLPMGPVRTLGDNRVGWIPNCEDAAPPGCAPVCKGTCCAFCAFCAVRYSNSARAFGGTCSACYAFCACYLVCTCGTRCARSTRFQNLTYNTVGHKSAPPARNVKMVAKGIYGLAPGWAGLKGAWPSWGYPRPAGRATAGSATFLPCCLPSSPCVLPCSSFPFSACNDFPFWVQWVTVCAWAGYTTPGGRRRAANAKRSVAVCCCGHRGVLRICQSYR